MGVYFPGGVSIGARHAGHDNEGCDSTDSISIGVVRTLCDAWRVMCVFDKKYAYPNGRDA